MDSNKRDYGVRWRLRLACSAAAMVGVFCVRPAAAESEVLTVSEVTIVGRVQKPIASVDVSRIQPKMTLAELRQPFLYRIEKAFYRSPF